MKVGDLISKLNYTALNDCDKETEISNAYTSDLLSDVMGNAPDDSVLMTIQAHKNTIAVATLAGINTIVLCNGRSAPEDMIESANEESIALISTKDDQFTSSWKIHQLLG